MSSDQQPVDPTKPDLEEITNVGQAHADVLRSAAAVAREQNLRENGLEPVSTWIMIAGFIVALVGGSVLLSSNNLFSYDSFVKDGYVQAIEESTGDNRFLLPAAEAYLKKGAAEFNACASCHAPDGNGQGNYPPIAGSEWVQGSGTVPALVVLHGLHGKISVKGKEYGTDSMPIMAAGKSDYELASLIYYIQNSMGNEVGVVYSPEQIAEIRDISKSHGQAVMDADTLKKYLDQPLKAKPLPEGAVLDFKTGEVVESAK